jgi:excisionase family DNA binding protein
MDNFVSVNDAIKLTQLSRATLYRMVDAGKLTLYKPGGAKRSFFKRTELEALFQPVAPSKESPKEDRPAA